MNRLNKIRLPEKLNPAYLKKSLKGIKLSSKFILSFLLFILLPFIIFGIINYQQSKRVLEKSVSELVMQNNIQVAKTLDYYLEDMKAFTSTLARNPLMLEYFKSLTKREELDLPDTDNVESAIYRMQLRDMANANKNIKPEGIYVISSDNVYNILYSSSPISLMDPYNDKWYSQTLSGRDEVYVLGTVLRFYEGGSNKLVFSTSKVVKETQHTVIHDVLLVDFNIDTLGDLMNIKSSHEFLNRDIYVVDNQNKIIYNNSKKLLGKTLDTALSDAVKKNSGIRRLTIDKEPKYVIYNTSGNSDWKVISVIPVDNVLKGVFFLKNPVIMLSLLLVMAVLIFFLVISSSILLKPIKELTTVLSEQNRGNALTNTVSPYGRSQAPSLSDSFNTISDVRHLIHKVYNIQLKQKEAELSSLQNQINPHFLYNTLESIRGAALYHGLNDIAAMSKSLSLFFRYSVSDRFLVPVRDEIQYLENYISIQNFRFENRFELIYNIPPEVYNYKILKLTLQPLVENSIKHGLERKVGRGRIRIEILDLENVLKIEVADNGMGMSLETLEALNRKLLRNSSLDDAGEDEPGKGAGTGIGVRNINSRIKLYFGEQYGLKFLKSEVGAVLEITLPVIKDDDR